MSFKVAFLVARVQSTGRKAWVCRFNPLRILEDPEARGLASFNSDVRFGHMISAQMHLLNVRDLHPYPFGKAVSVGSTFFVG
jgi:hypothetical protein